MDSDDDFMYDEDELSDPEDDQDDFDISCDVEAARDTSSSSFRDKGEDDDFNYVCLTPESIVVTMNKCIEEVNSVFQVCILKCLWQRKTGIFTAETIAQC